MFEYDEPSDPVLPVSMRRIIAIEETRRKLDAELAGLLWGLEVSGQTDELTGFHTSNWLADVARLPSKVASQWVKRAGRLADGRFEPLAEAFGSGRVGVQHVGVFERAANPRVVDALCVLLPELLDLADVATFERWSQEVRGIADRLDQDGAYDPAEDPENNQLSIVDTVDGVTHLRGTLVGELALMVKAVIAAETAKVTAKHQADLEVLRGAGVDDADMLRLASKGQRQAEALAGLCGRGAGVADADEKLIHPDVVVVIQPELDCFTGERTGNLAVCDEAGNRLSLQIVRGVLAAGLIRPMIVTERKGALQMGFTLRYANRDQRRALAYRDGGCVFPGCNAKAEQSDAHHVDEWDPHQHDDSCDDDCDEESTGPTDIANLALLCRHHHRVTHRAGWNMSRWISDLLEPGEIRFKWTTPGGAVIYSQHHHIRPG